MYRSAFPIAQWPSHRFMTRTHVQSIVVLGKRVLSDTRIREYRSCFEHSMETNVLSPGLEVNFATSTIFTAKICPV
ncbi:unnamed protein product [Lasius platythorax]|uniref:Uncharacterized protein n=1 Tax=Lasius platythorax TaxID=488582 RepID=A0AAV2P4D1_9HYME